MPQIVSRQVFTVYVVEQAGVLSVNYGSLLSTNVFLFLKVVTYSLLSKIYSAKSAPRQGQLRYFATEAVGNLASLRWHG